MKKILVSLFFCFSLSFGNQNFVCSENDIDLYFSSLTKSTDFIREDKATLGLFKSSIKFDKNILSFNAIIALSKEDYNDGFMQISYVVDLSTGTWKVPVNSKYFFMDCKGINSSEIIIIENESFYLTGNVAYLSELAAKNLY